jgi:predicted RNase H-like HicB family nuclease
VFFGFQYEIILYWSKEDQAFIAEMPDLPGCAADGATYQEACVNVELLIRNWIEPAQVLGRRARATRPAYLCMKVPRDRLWNSDGRWPKNFNHCRRVRGW